MMVKLTGVILAGAILPDGTIHHWRNPPTKLLSIQTVLTALPLFFTHIPY
jgi:hypothetical protein